MSRPTQKLDTIAVPTLDGGTYELRAVRRLPYRQGRKCRELRLDFSIPVKNTSGGSLNLTAANILAIIKAEVATFSSKFGRLVVEEVDRSISVDDLRGFSLELAERDAVEVVDDAGVTHELRRYDADSGNTITIGSGATVAVRIFLYRTYYVERLEGAADGLCPGASQMQQLGLEMVRGATSSYPTNFTRDGAGTVVVRTCDAPTRADRWAPVVRIARTSISAQRVDTLPEPGVLLALHETSAAHDATALGKVSLYLDGEPLYTNEEAADLAKWRKRTATLGAPDAGSLVTQLYSCDPHEELAELPAGARLEFEQLSHTVSTPKLSAIYVPAYSAEKWEAVVGMNIVGGKDGEPVVKLTIAGGAQVAGRAAAVLPATILLPSDTGYDTTPGLVIRAAGDSVTASEHVPAALASAAGQLAQAAQTAEGQRAAAAEAAAGIARTIPGFTSVVRGSITPRAEKLAGAILPRAVGAPADAMRAVSRRS